MNIGQILFSQVIECLHPEQFRRCVDRYPMARRSKNFLAWDHFLCMAFAQIIRLNSVKAKVDYPERLRRIRYVDLETGKSLVFISNHFELPALTVAVIYKNRWQIELFFKWIKQNLRIKVFHGTNPNAVRSQIWIAICVYLMVAILKKQHGIQENLGRILQVLSVNVFSKEPVNQLLTTTSGKNNVSNICNQLIFNDF